MLAVLEDSGRISVLPLVAGVHGGVRGLKDGTRVLDKAIGSAGGCLRFTPDGERLIAVDAKGKVVVAEFEKV